MMKSLHLRLYLVLIVTLLLSILPIPEFISVFRPPWVLLFVLYAEFFLPGTLRLSVLVLAGLLLDVLLATVIGEHSFALLVVTWIAFRISRRFRLFPMMQQIFIIGFFCFLYQLIITLITMFLGFNYNFLTPVATALVGMLSWPWICLLGEDNLLKQIVYR